jgi:hypothetical protein
MSSYLYHVSEMSLETLLQVSQAQCRWWVELLTRTLWFDLFSSVGQNTVQGRARMLVESMWAS